jgi:non-specific serine/threonine protein kinase
MVHKFITSGTIEEKIDMMIEEKSKLADDIIASSGEGWITELNNKQLMELFTLVSAGEK